MNRNAFIFHGTEGHPQDNWFPWLKEKLEAQGCKVFVPQFSSPEGVPAKISEWFDILKSYEKEINENTILIGHSLGGMFALKVLEQLKHSIKSAFFVGTPIGVKPILNYDRDNSFSGFDFNWKVIKSRAKNFTVYQSDNDPYVSLDNGKKLAENLGVELTFIPNAGHFNKRAGYLTFPALLVKVEEIL
ncbi:MAG: alpha/beta fold hydrolase [Patescibacteria group bacterium]